MPARHGASSNAVSGGGLFVYSMSKTESIPLPMDVVREALELDPTSPTWLRWKTRPRNHFARNRDWKAWNSQFSGNVAGFESGGVEGRKYWRVRINYKHYKAHRLVYALAYGIDPGTMQIDHISGDSQNNSPENLRLASNAENSRNRGKNRNNTSGRRGVRWMGNRNKWQAQIKINGRACHLGMFTCLDEAAAAYDVAARQYFGEFYREEKTK